MKDKKYDGVKLFKVNHKGYHDMSNVAQPLVKKDFSKLAKALGFSARMTVKSLHKGWGIPVKVSPIKVI